MIGCHKMTTIKMLLLASLISNVGCKGLNETNVQANGRMASLEGGQQAKKQSSFETSRIVDVQAEIVEKQVEMRISKTAFKHVNPTTIADTSINYYLVSQKIPKTTLAVHQVSKRNTGKCNYNHISMILKSKDSNF
jgi:hypothetical protein